MIQILALTVLVALLIQAIEAVIGQPSLYWAAVCGVSGLMLWAWVVDLIRRTVRRLGRF